MRYILSFVGIKTQEEENDASRKLLSLFSDEDNTLRVNAISAYGRIRRTPPDGELFHLINLLKDEDYTIRYYAAKALGRLKVAIALDALKQMVRDETGDHPRASAIWAILQIEPSFSDDIKKNHWEDQYIRLLYDDDIDERKFAATILRLIGTEKSLRYLKEIYEDYEKRRDMDGKLFYAIDSIEERIKKRDI